MARVSKTRIPGVRSNTLTFAVADDLLDALVTQSQLQRVPVGTVAREYLRAGFSSNPITQVERDRMSEQAKRVRVYCFKKLGTFLKELQEEVERGTIAMQEGEVWPPEDA